MSFRSLFDAHTRLIWRCHLVGLPVFSLLKKLEQGSKMWAVIAVRTKSASRINTARPAQGWDVHASRTVKRES
jgi:hypothetical protein